MCDYMGDGHMGDCHMAGGGVHAMPALAPAAQKMAATIVHSVRTTPHRGSTMGDEGCDASTCAFVTYGVGNTFHCQCHVGERQAGVTHYAEDVALTLEAGFSGTKIDSCGNQRDMTAYAELFAAANRTMLVESCGNGPAGTEPKEDFPPQVQ